MIEMKYHDDGKEKYQSHEISIREHICYNDEVDIWSINPFNITGHGATKEEAIEDFKNKFKYVMKELKAFETTLLLNTDEITDNIVVVDCLGRPIKNDYK